MKKQRKEYTEFFQRSGFSAPQPVELPPVELKGFNGRKEITSKGLQWTVKLGSLYGNVTTYVVPGATPFLLSRKVLEGMEASIDMGKMTISSSKHGMQNEPVKQTSNGHMLLPLCQIFEVDDNADQERNRANHEHVCVCCNQHEHEEPDKHHALDAEALFGEDHNWVDAVSTDTIPQDSQDHLLRSIRHSVG